MKKIDTVETIDIAAMASISGANGFLGYGDWAAGWDAAQAGKPITLWDRISKTGDWRNGYVWGMKPISGLH